jgi:hypothetical protein
VNPETDFDGAPASPPALPPPVPAPAVQVVTTPGWKTVVLALGTVGVLLVAGIAGFALLFHYTTREFEVTAEHRAALHRAEDLQEWYEFEVDEACESWRGERMIDGAVEIEYEYDDPRDEVPYLNASLHYEPKQSDALANFTLLWQGAKAGVGLGAEGDMEVEEVKDLFQWGDASRFAYLTQGGVRHGMIFCGRKGKRVYLLMTGGACLEEAADLEKFLRPKLDAAEKVKVGKS